MACLLHNDTACTYSSAGVPVEDLLCVSQSDETDYLLPRLECHAASNQSVSLHFFLPSCQTVFVPDMVREYSQPLDQLLFR